MSLEKTAVFAISALVGSCAALKSRQSRLRAGEALEASLSNASPAAEPTLKVVSRSRNQRSWMLIAHALVTCCAVWILTDVPRWSEDVWMVTWCLGLVVGLVMHIVGHCSSVEQSPVLVPVQEGGGVPIILDDYECICNGRWMKDRDASDSMDPVCDLMAIGGIMRFALQCIIGSDVCFLKDNNDKGTFFSFAAFSVVKWFKIREVYPTWGEPARHRRRDLRPGGMHGTMMLTDTSRFSAVLNRQVNTPIVEITNEFGGYRPGTLQEVFRWPEDGLMVVDSVITNDHGSARFTQIFRKS